jgi:hypothetical protein
MASKRSERPFPTREEVIAFIRESKGPVGKREIVRAFQIRTAPSGVICRPGNCRR